MIKAGSKVLIVSNRPSQGGVQTLLRFVIDSLMQRDCDITLAYYQPFSVTPQLSVPLHRLAGNKPSWLEDRFYNQISRGLGCWLPELEVTHYYATKQWRSLIEAHEVHLVVSGSCLPALGLLQSNKKFLAWVASDWQGDRLHRVQQLPIYRRLFDYCVIAPLARKIQKRIINSGHLVALSEPTKLVLNHISGTQNVVDTLAMPIATDLFKPTNVNKMDFTVGFVGRFEDPRKNVALLFQVLAVLLHSYPKVNLLLIGDELSTASHQCIKSLGLDGRVQVHGNVQAERLPAYIQQMDVFVVPSHQEGLCIAALEAMSCGVPVVSTRCGGPESFIIDGENGRLCEHDSQHISAAIAQIFSDDELRMRYASAARKTIIERFSVSVLEAQFWQLLDNKYAG